MNIIRLTCDKNVFYSTTLAFLSSKLFATSFTTVAKHSSVCMHLTSLVPQVFNYHFSFFYFNFPGLKLMEQVARMGENYLLCCEIKDAFSSFRQLKQKCATSAPLKALDGKLLSDRASVTARWQEHFSILLNRPTQSPPDALVSEAQASTPYSTIDTFPPTITGL